MKIILTAAFLLLAACKTLPSETQQIEAVCASATSSIQVATYFKERLSDAQAEQVLQGITAVQPVCGNPDVIPTLDSVKRQALEAAAAKLSQIASEVQP